MKKTLFLVLHAAAAVCASAASQYTWVNGSTDWESESSYVEDGKPAVGDVVYFPANTTGRVDDASIAFVSTLSRIALQDPSSVLVIDISTNATLGCGVNRGEILNSGTVYKRGAGTLQLALSATYSYHTAWIIEEGDLKMPQDVASSSTQSFYGRITVNAGCTLYTMYPGKSRVREISGMGIVTNVANRLRTSGYLWIQHRHPVRLSGCDRGRHPRLFARQRLSHGHEQHVPRHLLRLQL